MNKFLITLLVILVPGFCHSRSVITPSDFTYIGGFRTPLVEEPRSLTVRYKGGTPYLYSTYPVKDSQGALIDFRLIEMNIPTLQTTYTSFTRAEITHTYGDVWGAALRDTVYNGSADCEASPCIGISGGASTPSGIYWDEIDQRLYWVKTVNYNNSNDPGDPSDTAFGYSTLNDTAHTGTGIASWMLDERRADNNNWGGRWAFSVFPIPAVVADELDGRRIGIGAGGGVSIISNGPPSMGPAAFAVKPPSTSVEAAYSYLAAEPIPLVHHQLSRAKRSPSYLGLNMSSGDAGYLKTDEWFAEDETKHGVWISEVNKHGFLAIGKLGGGNLNTTITAFNSSTSVTVADAGDTIIGDLLRVDTAASNFATGYTYDRVRVSGVTGNTITFATPLLETYQVGDKVQAGTWYWGGGPEDSRVYTMAYIYSEDDLLAVAQGTKQADALVPTYNELWPLPSNIPNPGAGRTSGGGVRSVRGVTYDPTSKRLYVMFSTEEMANPSDVFVYQLNEEIVDPVCSPSNQEVCTVENCETTGGGYWWGAPATCHATAESLPPLGLHFGAGGSGFFGTGGGGSLSVAQ